MTVRELSKAIGSKVRVYVEKLHLASPDVIAANTNRHMSACEPAFMYSCCGWRAIGNSLAAYAQAGQRKRCKKCGEVMKWEGPATPQERLWFPKD